MSMFMSPFLLSLLLSLTPSSFLPFFLQCLCFRIFAFWERSIIMRKTLYFREVQGSTRAYCGASDLQPGQSGKQVMEESKGGQTWAEMWGTHWEHDWEPLWCVSASVHLCLYLEMIRCVCVCGCLVFVSLSMGTVACCWPHVPSSGRSLAVLWANEEFMSHGIPLGPVLPGGANC